MGSQRVIRPSSRLHNPWYLSARCPIISPQEDVKNVGKRQIKLPGHLSTPSLLPHTPRMTFESSMVPVPVKSMISKSLDDSALTLTRFTRQGNKENIPKIT